MLFLRRLLYSLLMNGLMFSILLFGPAMRWRWPRAGILLGVVLMATATTMITVFRNNDELYRERTRSPIQKDQPLADKLILIPFILAFFGQIVFVPLDVFYWHLLAKPGAIVSALGLLLFIAGWVLITLVFRENAFAAPVVKHQKERQQRVVDTGVYSIVRHPMYTGVVLLLPGLALWLESTAGAWASLVPSGLLMIRILIEEQFLKRELTGYVDYTKRVRWRLIPGLW